jgi:hypothetical protein
MYGYNTPFSTENHGKINLEIQQNFFVGIQLAFWRQFDNWTIIIILPKNNSMGA